MCIYCLKYISFNVKISNKFYKFSTYYQIMISMFQSVTLIDQNICVCLLKSDK